MAWGSAGKSRSSSSSRSSAQRAATSRISKNSRLSSKSSTSTPSSKSGQTSQVAVSSSAGKYVNGVRVRQPGEVGSIRHLEAVDQARNIQRQKYEQAVREGRPTTTAGIIAEQETARNALLNRQDLSRLPEGTFRSQTGRLVTVGPVRARNEQYLSQPVNMNTPPRVQPVVQRQSTATPREDYTYDMREAPYRSEIKESWRDTFGGLVFTQGQVNKVEKKQEFQEKVFEKTVAPAAPVPVLHNVKTEAKPLSFKEKFATTVIDTTPLVGPFFYGQRVLKSAENKYIGGIQNPQDKQIDFYSQSQEAAGKGQNIKASWLAAKSSYYKQIGDIQVERKSKLEKYGPFLSQYMPSARMGPISVAGRMPIAPAGAAYSFVKEKGLTNLQKNINWSGPVSNKERLAAGLYMTSRAAAYTLPVTAKVTSAVIDYPEFFALGPALKTVSPTVLGAGKNLMYASATGYNVLKTPAPHWYSVTPERVLVGMETGIAVPAAFNSLRIYPELARRGPKYESLTVQTQGGESKTLARGITLGKNRLIRIGADKPIPSDINEYIPGTKWQSAQWDKMISSSNLPDVEKSAYFATTDLAYEAAGSKSPVSRDLIGGRTKTATAGQNKAFLDFAKQNRGVAYGSYTQKPAVSKWYKSQGYEMDLSGDIDTQFQYTTAELNPKVVKWLGTTSNIKGPKLNLETQKGLLVVGKGGKFGGEIYSPGHAYDIHAIDSPQDVFTPSNDYLLGMRLGKNIKAPSVSGTIEAMNPEEGIIRYAASSASLTGKTIGPRDYRFKDVANLYYQSVPRLAGNPVGEQKLGAFVEAWQAKGFNVFDYGPSPGNAVPYGPSLKPNVPSSAGVVQAIPASVVSGWSDGKIWGVGQKVRRSGKLQNKEFTALREAFYDTRRFASQKASHLRAVELAAPSSMRGSSKSFGPSPGFVKSLYSVGSSKPSSRSPSSFWGSPSPSPSRSKSPSSWPSPSGYSPRSPSPSSPPSSPPSVSPSPYSPPSPSSYSPGSPWPSSPPGSPSPVPFLPIVPFPGGMFAGGPKGPSKARKKHKYRASLAAEILGISGKPLKGSLSGLEIRPVPYGYKTKKRRKKR